MSKDLGSIQVTECKVVDNNGEDRTIHTGQNYEVCPCCGRYVAESNLLCYHCSKESKEYM